MINIYLNDKCIFNTENELTVHDIRKKLCDWTGLKAADVYALYNGKLTKDENVISNGNLRFVTKVLGGKGGFGSMLRAIGAQIEKTTNREACRDLSGRRLRDINEEKRLKTWISNQSDREQEAAERKQQKIQRLCSKPKHEFHDKSYDQERSQMTENVADAVEVGFQSTSKHQAQKRKSNISNKNTKKKSRLWIDAEEEDLSLSSDDSSSDEKESTSLIIRSVNTSNSNDSLVASETAKQSNDQNKISVNAF